MTSELTRSAISKTKMTKEFFETQALFEGHKQFFVRGENVKTSSLYETRAIVFTMHAQKISNMKKMMQQAFPSRNVARTFETAR